MTINDEMRKQQQLFFERLEGQRKEEFFVSFFESEVVSLLREMRKEKNLTQGDIAKRAGLKQGNVSKIENLEKTPTLTTVGKYLFALDFSLEETSEFASCIVSHVLNGECVSLSFEAQTKPKQFEQQKYFQADNKMSLGGFLK